MRQVPAEGPRDRPLLAIIGEAPGAHEEVQGRPFVGPSGQLFDRMLATAGITRGECYITNVSKVRPPGNNFAAMYYDDGDFRYPNALLAQARTDLVAELRAIRPSVVVAMGAEALKALTPQSSIKNARGCMASANAMRVLPTYHPSYLLRGMMEERPVVEADLKKALRQARVPYKPWVDFNLDPTFDQCMTFLRSCPKRVALDIETVGNLTRCVGFATSKHHAISIPLMKGYSHAWTHEQEIELLTAMDGFLRNPHIEKIIQNLTYEWTVMARELGLKIVNCVMDTMLAHHVLLPELPKGLDFQASVYTDHHMYWGYNASDWRSTAEYNCYDCVVTFECAEAHEASLRSRDMWDFYQRVVRRSAEALCYIQSRGTLIDLPAREAIRATTEAEMVEIKARLAVETGVEINPSSPKQVGELVYGKYRLPIQLDPKTKKQTTNDDALSALAKKSPTHAKVINDILGYRQRRTLISTFCDMHLDEGRVKTSYNVAGTVTGRLASSATIDDVGGNLQNIPRGAFRRVFVADPGKTLIKADLSQAEYRVVMWKARVERAIKRWVSEPGFNIHMWNASENIYHRPVSEITKTQYANAKSGVFGANYGIRELKISRMYGIPYQESKMILENYYRAVPEIKAVYWPEIEDALRTTREIVNPIGRKRLFLGLFDDEMFRAAYSHYAQSTIADIINLAIGDLQDVCFDQPTTGLEILLQVHDELVCQCWTNQLEAGCRLVEKALVRPVAIPGASCPLVIPCELKVGPNWYDMESLDKWKERQHDTRTSQRVA